MSNLTHIEKQKLERELGMASGYVLNFSNRTFNDFFSEVVGVNIYDQLFDKGSGSKAQRLRAFWDISTDEQLVIFLEGLIEAWEIYSEARLSTTTRDILQSIVLRLTGKVSSQKADTASVTRNIDESVSLVLMQKLIKLSELQPRVRGYEFERFLKGLFDAYGLTPRASFRMLGEQIDGSFQLQNDTYLLEAKWQNAPVGAADLHTFEGKLGEKASWSRGLFVSISGFSQDGLIAFGRGKKVVCMDGFDLYETLRLRISFEVMMAAKVRRAAETGRPFVTIRELDF